MSYLEGFEDLKPKAVLSIDLFSGTVSCVGVDGKAMTLQLYVTPQGSLQAHPMKPASIDQVGERKVVRRHAGVDQI